MITRAGVIASLLIGLSVTSAALLASQDRAPALKIVVIEGEGAVNIIQQKTAVAPLIEVRDRNDQPVAGATVSFVVRAGRATFGGARTLTVTTNAAGRAAAAGFAPSGTGALQIGATATFQGQTAAAVTIAQTNVMTAAEAAAASSAASAGSSTSGGSAASGGAGASSGGGMSLTTVGIVGGAVAAGVVAKQKFLSGTTFTGHFSGLLLLAGANDDGTPGCTNNESMNATVKLTFDSTDDPLSGEFRVDDTEMQLSPGTCTPDSYNTGKDYFPTDSGTVSGSRDNVTATGVHRNNYTNTAPPGGGGVNAYDYTFTGRFDSDDQITGSLTITRTVTWRPADGRPGGTSTGTVTSQVVLRK